MEEGPDVLGSMQLIGLLGRALVLHHHQLSPILDKLLLEGVGGVEYLANIDDKESIWFDPQIGYNIALGYLLNCAIAS